LKSVCQRNYLGHELSEENYIKNISTQTTWKQQAQKKSRNSEKDLDNVIAPKKLYKDDTKNKQTLTIDDKTDKNSTATCDENKNLFPESEQKFRMLSGFDRKSLEREKNLNIEKKRETRGEILEDRDDFHKKNEDVPVSKLLESRLTRTQFRTISPQTELISLSRYMISKQKNCEEGCSPPKTRFSGWRKLKKKDEYTEENKKQPNQRLVIGKKRDTMLRELKSKLKEKFPNNTVYKKDYHVSNLKTPEISSEDSVIEYSEVVSEKSFCLHQSVCTSERGLTPPPNPPPTGFSLKNSTYSSLSDIEDINYDSKSKSMKQETSSNLLFRRHEMLYGPGGIYGSHGPFSTPSVSRYPETTKKQNEEDLSLKSGSSNTETSDSAVFAEDRSDKSQYIANTVIKVSTENPETRLDNYKNKIAHGWQQNKKQRTISWITKNQESD